MKDTEAKTTHTPGPWEIREVAHEATPLNKRRVYRVEIIAPQYLNGRRTHSRDIAQIVDFADWTDQPANARLIAAAPELLAALTDLRRESESFVSLARQRGQDVRPEAADLVRNALATARAALAKAEGR